MVRRTKEEAAQTREHLLDTAEQVFLSEGVARTSLQRIADAARLTRGAIYWHFKDKAELFTAMMERVRLPCEAAHMALQQQCTEHTPRSAPDPLSALRAFAWVPIERVLQDEQTHRAVAIAIHRTEYSDDMSPVLTHHVQVRQDYCGRAERLVRDAQASGAIAPEHDPRDAAEGLMALIDGLLAQLTLERPDPQRRERLQAQCHRVLDIYLRGLLR